MIFISCIDHQEDVSSNESSQKSISLTKSTTTPFLLHHDQSCFHCEVEEIVEGYFTMSSMMGAHTAFKVREHLNENSNANSNSKPMESFCQPKQTFAFSKKDDLADANNIAKYSGKLMNSIWGQYNRYSVHNIKSHIAFEKA